LSLEFLGSVPSLLVSSDFDGTLSELIDDILAATPLPRSLAALSRLAGTPGTHVAIVSGRRRSDLVARFPDKRLILIGEHGADAGGGVQTEAPVLDAVRGRISELGAQVPGSVVEQKNHSVVFHYRTAHDYESAVEEIRRMAADSVGITLLDGKDVLELTDSTTNKGKAISALRLSLAAGYVLFIGDDVTDETVFASLHPPDVTVHVGSGPTEAQLSVPDVEAVADLLEALATAREAL
jgi:trehalose 6-phosphate phosphatase